MNLAIIDVQPCYRRGADAVRDALVPLLNRGDYANVVFIRANEELSGDTAFDAMDYWVSAGLRTEILDRAAHVEKSYAFFRGWMDYGVADASIVEATQLLRSHNKWDSRALSAKQLDAIDTDLPEFDPVFRPYELEEVADLFKPLSWALCGGGRNECLKEFELWMDSLGVAHERLEHLVYG